MNKEKLESIFSDDLGTSYFPILAESYVDDGEYDLALKVLDTGLLLNPDNNDGKYIKAKICMLHSDSSEGVRLLKEILESDNLYINAMKMLALHYQSTGYNQSSLEKILNKIIDLLPGDKFALDLMRSSKKSKKSKSNRKSKIKPQKRTSKSEIKKITNNSSTQIVSNITINEKMATLTFVDILIKQKQFVQAGQLLDVISNKKTVSKESIEQRKKKINIGITKQDSE